MSLLSPQLEAFVAITKCGTVHGAATNLHITQTAVTQRIRALESKLKVTLFIRTRRGMILTLEGEALLRYCHASQLLEGETLAKIQKAGIASTVRICITGPTSIMSSRVIPQCLLVMKNFPNLLMHFDINDVENRDRSLKVGNSDFAILQLEDVAREMASKKLHSEQYVLVGASAWRKRSFKEVIQTERIIDFTPIDQMTYNYLRAYGLFELASRERNFVNRTENIAKMISAGYGYGVLTQEFSQPYVERGELIILNEGKIYENKMALAWYDRHEAPEYFSELIRAIN